MELLKTVWYTSWCYSEAVWEARWKNGKSRCQFKEVLVSRKDFLLGLEVLREKKEKSGFTGVDHSISGKAGVTCLWAPSLSL